MHSFLKPSSDTRYERRLHEQETNLSFFFLLQGGRSRFLDVCQRLHSFFLEMSSCVLKCYRCNCLLGMVYTTLNRG